MKLYQLEVAREEYQAEGEDHDEWFSSLDAAKKRRAALLKHPECWKDHVYGEDFAIYEVIIDSLPLKELLLAIFNRNRGKYEVSRKLVVQAAQAPKDQT